MSLEGLSEEEIRQYEQELLGKVPTDGSPIGNVTLSSDLGWEDELYWSIRNRLIGNGVLEKGRGRGGSVRRAESHEIGTPEIHADPLTASMAPATSPGMIRRVPEDELYEPMSKAIHERWAKEAGFDAYFVEVIAKQGRRETGGKWSRPDILVAAMTTYPWVPGKYLDVITFEVKPADFIDITAVYEAVAHYRAAHRAYVLLHVPDWIAAGTEDILSEICEEAKRQGIGVIVADDPADGTTWDERIEAVRHEPEPKRLNDFLAKQAGSLIKDKIIRWFR